MKNINLGAPFLQKVFFDNLIQKKVLFLKWRPIFDELSFDGFKQFSDFIWLQLIFGQKPCLPGEKLDID